MRICFISHASNPTSLLKINFPLIRFRVRLRELNTGLTNLRSKFATLLQYIYFQPIITKFQMHKFVKTKLWENWVTCARSWIQNPTSNTKSVNTFLFSATTKELYEVVEFCGLMFFPARATKGGVGKEVEFVNYTPRGSVLWEKKPVLNVLEGTLLPAMSIQVVVSSELASTPSHIVLGCQTVSSKCNPCYHMDKTLVQLSSIPIHSAKE